MTNDLAITEAQQRRVFFEKQLAQTSERLATAQKSLQGSGISEGALRTEPKAAADAFASLRAQTTAAEIKLQTLRHYLTEDAIEFKAAQSTLAALRTQLAKVESSSSGGDSNDYIGKYREFKYQETLFDLFARQYELAKLDESREGALIQIVDVATPPERHSKPRRALLSASATMASGILLMLYVFVGAGWRNLKARAALPH